MIQLLDAKNIEEIFIRFERNSPSPKSELYFTNTFTLLVAVVLSAQATDSGVNKATYSFFKAADTAKKMVALGEEGIKSYIKTINLYPTKAKRIFELSKIIENEYEGCVPDCMDDLIKLPGVGRKTANVVLNMAFKKPVIAVDTHIFRTSLRLGLSEGKTPFKVEEDLIKIIPPTYLLNAHHWILLHGRYICKARKPQCISCFLSDICMKNMI